MKIIMLGAPGSGKGTQAKKIVNYLDIPHISTGDIFRYHISENTPLGTVVKETIAHGGLVPDSITIKIVHDRLLQPDCKKGFVLDGFPRSLPQAEALDKEHDIDFVLNLEINEETAIRRMVGRLTCKNCGAMYHIDFVGGAAECAKCGGELYVREDDNLDSVIIRLKMYESATKPLVEHYRKQGKLLNIDADAEPDKVFMSIAGALK